jgi:hypothetical protein
LIRFCTLTIARYFLSTYDALEEQRLQKAQRKRQNGVQLQEQQEESEERCPAATRYVARAGSHQPGGFYDVASIT